MDMRVERTERNIRSAFLKLRAKKPLEKITIRELSAMAEINKATFYLHYHDIYDLAEKVETDIIAELIASIKHPEYLLTNTYEFVRELSNVCFTNAAVIRILFSDDSRVQIPERIESEILKEALRKHPELENNESFRTFLSYSVYGGFFAFTQQTSAEQYPFLMETIGNMAVATRKIVEKDIPSSLL